MTRPLVSVIIPTYNRDEIVSRAIESVLGQTYKKFELIVVDDASTDGTEDVIRNYSDERINYICHDINRHVSAARNTGLEHASGDYIAFLDDDDEWLPTKLEKQVSCLQNTNTETGLVYCWMEYRDGNATVKQYQPRLKGDIFEAAIGGQPIGGCSTLVVQRNVIDQIGGFDESLPRGNDGDFIRRVAYEFDVTYVPEILLRYYMDRDRDRITKETISNIKNAIKSNEIKLKKFATELEQNPRLKSEIYARLGLRHCQLGNYQTGVSYHLKAIQKNPLNLAVYHHQAVTIHRLLTGGCWR